MAFEPYDPCPCGSGKKIKWCCHALAGEMERIERLRENGQEEAALRSLTELQENHPGNAWILTTRALLFLHLGRREEMAREIHSAHELHPDNARVILLYALVEVQEKEVEEAMPLAQSALERAASESPALAGSLASVTGLSFLRAGHTFAALQHLTLGINLNPDDEHTALLLHKLMGEPEISLLLKEDYRMQPAALGSSQPDWAPEFNEVCSLAGRGAWLATARGLEEIKERAGDTKSLWYNLGICYAAVGLDQEAAEALRRYAALETNLDDAVETIALAELLSTEEGETINRLAIRYPVTAASALKQAFESHPKFRSISPTAEELEEEESPDESRYDVLDRAQPEEASELSLDDLPQMLGVIRLNDPPESDPQVVLTALEGERLEGARKALQEVAGHLLGDPAEPEVIEEVSKETDAMAWRWAPPKGMTPRALRDFFARGRARLFEEVWIDLPRARFGGKSPREAAAEPSLQNRLLANLLLIELQTQSESTSLDVNRLREALGLPVPEPIDPEEVDVDEIPMARMHRLVPERLADDDLTSLYSLAASCSATAVVERFGEALTRRPELQDRIDLGIVFTRLSDIARFQGNRDRALQWVAAGRSFDKQQGKTDREHEWDLLDILTRLMDPDEEQLRTAINDYMQKYRDDPEASERLLNLLISVGAIHPDQLRGAGAVPERAIPEPVSAQTGIWTPGGESSQSEQVKIWTPGDA